MSTHWNLPSPPPYLIAHYMPWFTIQTSPTDATVTWNHWKWTGGGPAHDPEKILDDGRRDIASVQYPLIGPYNSWSRAVVRYHVQTMRAAGISALAAIWYGPKSDTDDRIPLLLEEAERAGLRVAICYEEKINFPPYRKPKSRGDLVESAASDLSYIIKTYGAHPAYLKRDGKPFVFQFNYWGTGKLGPNYLTPAEWREVFLRLPKDGLIYGRQNIDEEYHPPIQSNFVWWTTDAAYLDRFARRSSEMVKEGRLTFFMNMICPGFDDTGVWGWGAGPRKFDRHGLSVLRDTFDRSFVGDPELIQIITWNDFAEGTAVEPTRGEGFQYLDAIETWWGQRTGRAVDLEDNRAPFLEYVKTCSEAEKADLPKGSLDEFLVRRSLDIEISNVLTSHPSR